MIYKKFKDIELSALGLGCMRLPVVDGDYGNIDKKKTAEMVRYAIDNGVNYFDTAYMYHKNTSESVMGEILSAYPRDSFYLATKFPGVDKENMPYVKEIFEKQLKNCRVDHFDFYLFHCVDDNNIDEYLDPKFGVYDYLIKQKRNGRIKYLGFSTHGTINTTRRFLEAYGKEIDFCQMQLNWLDWELQDAKGTYELLREYNLPVWVMEPVRGGSLAKLEKPFEDELRVLRPTASVPEWAFRFLQSLPDVTVTLSGMSNMEQLTENIATFSTHKPLTDKETEALLSISKRKIAQNGLPCTACRYCVDYCPQGLNIPRIIELYNEFNFSESSFAGAKIAEWEEPQKPSACINCRACEKMCPQGIKIADMMRDFATKLNK